MNNGMHYKDVALQMKTEAKTTANDVEVKHGWDVLFHEKTRMVVSDFENYLRENRASTGHVTEFFFSRIRAG